MDKLTAQDCLKKLEEVDDKIEYLTSVYLTLLDKEEKDLLPSEKRKVKEFDANLAKLEAEKKEWIELLKKTQSQQQGIK